MGDNNIVRRATTLQFVIYIVLNHFEIDQIIYCCNNDISAQKEHTFKHRWVIDLNRF